MWQKELKLQNTAEVESKHTLLLINVEANIDTSDPQFCFNPADYLMGASLGSGMTSLVRQPGCWRNLR